jgi:hypothetical protein
VNVVCAFVCIVYCPFVAFWEVPHSSSMPFSCGIFCYRIMFTTCFSGHISRSISRFRLLVNFLLNSLARWRSPDWNAFLVRGIHDYSSFLAIFLHLLVYGSAKSAVGNFCNILLISCNLHIRTIFQLQVSMHLLADWMVTLWLHFWFRYPLFFVVFFRSS